MRTYYIFGSRVSATISEFGFEELEKLVVKHKATLDMTLYEFDGDPNDLLSTYDGWNGWAELTEDQYFTLKKIIDGDQ